ncbi:hypothetical protein T484DRAFT_1763120 [Baffinella frigidus]|nr:hypothetical protein T484DRAFT_1763120 [Cryptophyta sp. CCMP2293]
MGLIWRCGLLPPASCSDLKVQFLFLALIAAVPVLMGDDQNALCRAGFDASDFADRPGRALLKGRTPVCVLHFE